ncbi:DegV family protein [Ammoniphilus sp. CFH 90114]|uniref:DegV family protein n=1 Tax=Ammoniphilus sp. CFH 90114 TaxID=2493665 RepID=UPI00100F12AF|nr:DegV family protein [Ammoniphilus sp. CFH 90114]RXT15057.1 DegV family protein [Ammoniphilus sp. CFH 90114]
MARICIVTDSTADIPKALAEELSIRIVPLKVHISGETYLDGVNITPTVFFHKLRTTEQFPTTSQPSPGDFEQVYMELAEEYGQDVQIISIHLSSALSGTYQSANLAKNMVEPPMDITVVDSKKAAYLLGTIVVQAAKAVKNGKTKEECLELVNRMIIGQREFFVLDTLTYLQKGGRIGKAQAVIGTLLNVKPILSLNEAGEVYPFDKVRGKKKAMATMIGELKEYAGNHEVIASILYAMNPEEAEQLKTQLEEEFNVSEIALSEIGPVIGAHVGPNVLAISMFKV